MSICLFSRFNCLLFYNTDAKAASVFYHGQKKSRLSPPTQKSRFSISDAKVAFLYIGRKSRVSDADVGFDEFVEFENLF